jgi:ferredoxin
LKAPRVDQQAPRRARAGSLAAAALIALTLAPAWLAAQYQKEPPDFGGAYSFPTASHPLPRADLERWLDVGVLAVGLGLSAWLVLRRRSRTGVMILGIAALAYFGFYKRGCVCPIGSIQNITLALSDPAHPASLAVVGIFFLPLVATLLFGRVFCGGVCPHGALQDLVLLRPVRVPRKLDRALGLLKYLYLAMAVLFAGWGIHFSIAGRAIDAGRRFIICEWDPFVSLFRLAGPFTILAIGAGFLAAGMFIGRPYCRWLCPYGAILSILSRVAWKNFRITPDQELDCGLCAGACPYGAIHRLRAQRSSCLSCARCYAYCPRDREARRGCGSGEPLVQVESSLR